MGATKLAFSGGEPLIWSHIYDALLFAKEKGIITIVYTAGNVDDHDKTFKLLAECGLNMAIFSMYAATPDKHELITRTRGSFNKTLAAIDTCKKYKIHTELHFVATSNNYHELAGICDIAKHNGIEGVSILRFVPQGRGKMFESGILSKKQNLELIAEIKSLRKNGHKIRTGSPMNVFHINDNPQCLAGIDRLIVSPDLRIYPCDAFKQIDAEDIVATSELSILGSSTLEECWEASPYLCRVRDVLSSAPVGKCSTCPSIKTCNTGCLAQKFLAYGKLERCSDPACLLK